MLNNFTGTSFTNYLLDFEEADDSLRSAYGPIQPIGETRPRQATRTLSTQRSESRVSF